MSERRRSGRPGYRRVTVSLPEDLCEEVRMVAGYRGLSSWVEEAIREKLEAERRRRLLRELPNDIREKLVKTAGSEEAATRLLIKVIEKGLAEIEEDEVEEAAQEAISFMHKQERLAEMKARL
jgi:predicted RND superfamily exporter protein